MLLFGTGASGGGEAKVDVWMMSLATAGRDLTGICIEDAAVADSATSGKSPNRTTCGSEKSTNRTLAALHARQEKAMTSEKGISG